ncbi:hypothetical protein ZWY2020_024815 [Hordeum vulgare]|nr:hypothetical protein ZWY2020_024815 [Hordeum vulgare]
MLPCGRRPALPLPGSAPLHAASCADPTLPTCLAPSASGRTAHVRLLPRVRMSSRCLPHWSAGTSAPSCRDHVVPPALPAAGSVRLLRPRPISHGCGPVARSPWLLNRCAHRTFRSVRLRRLATPARPRACARIAYTSLGMPSHCVGRPPVSQPPGHHARTPVPSRANC